MKRYEFTFNIKFVLVYDLNSSLQTHYHRKQYQAAVAVKVLEARVEGEDNRRVNSLSRNSSTIIQDSEVGVDKEKKNVCLISIYFHLHGL